MAQAKNKTVPTDLSVQAYFDAIADETRRQDCLKLTELMRAITKEEARMWGAGIVGFGSYHYRYESGREGDSCAVGFASRKGDISVYLVAGFDDRDELLAKLGRHKMGKCCLYIRKLTEIDLAVLRSLIEGSIGEMRRRYR